MRYEICEKLSRILDVTRLVDDLFKNGSNYLASIDEKEIFKPDFLTKFAQFTNQINFQNSQISKKFSFHTICNKWRAASLVSN